MLCNLEVFLLLDIIEYRTCEDQGALSRQHEVMEEKSCILAKYAPNALK